MLTSSGPERPIRIDQCAVEIEKDGALAGGVDANASKRHLLDIARRLDVRGRSTMAKSELVEAIKKHNRRVRGR